MTGLAIWLSVRVQTKWLSCCGHLTYIYRACFEQGGPWNSFNYMLNVTCSTVFFHNVTYAFRVKLFNCLNIKKLLAPVLSKEFLDIQVITECSFTPNAHVTKSKHTVNYTIQLGTHNTVQSFRLIWLIEDTAQLGSNWQ